MASMELLADIIVNKAHVKSKNKVLYKKIRIQIGKETLKNLILALLSLMNMGLCPIKIVHHTQKI